jgi:hypothetical protein
MAVPNEVITWSLGGNGTTDKGGVPVAMEWDTASMIDHGGFDSFSGSFPLPMTGGVVARPNPFPSNWAPGVEATQGIDPVAIMHLPKHARQGQIVTGTRKNGKIVWKGVISQPPRIIEGRVTVKAEGWKVLVERGTDRVAFQLADATQWSRKHEAPFSVYGNANGSKFSLWAKKDSLGFDQQTVAYVNADNDGYGLYLGAAGPIGRFKFTYRNDGMNANFDIRTFGALDLGGATQIDTFAASTADSTAKNIDVTGAGNYNTLIVQLHATAGFTPGATHRCWLENVTVTNTDVGNSTTFTGGQVAADIANRLGYTDKTTTGSTNLLPYDSTGSWTDLMDYAAMCEDYCWLVIDDPTNQNPAAMYFRPYGNKTWRTSMQQIANDSLEIQPLYNRWTTNYFRPRNVPQHLTNRPSDFGITDPLQGSAIPFPWPEPEQLDHPQRSTNLASTINQLGLTRMTKMRLQGSCTVNALFGPGVPFDMMAGDTLIIGDFLPPVGAQRIAAINYNADGTATVTLDRYFDLEDTLRKARHHVRRHRR